jgi:anthranilate phosphoribosyltransferase
MAQDGKLGEHRFAQYLKHLARGPGRTRSLTREEAFDAFAMILSREAEPMQVGAFLLLKRYLSENAEEMAGFVEASREHIAKLAPRSAYKITPDLDWPSYAAGKSRTYPWFLLSALCLAQSGVKVMMHGFNSFHNQGLEISSALAALGLSKANSFDQAAKRLKRDNFAYLPLDVLSPILYELIGLRPVLGLRTPVNTLVRLLNPLRAEASFHGIFHPSYLPIHTDSSLLLAQPRMGVIKGGGGEAERNPLKACELNYVMNGVQGKLKWPPLLEHADKPKKRDMTLKHFLAVWRGDVSDTLAEATIIGTAALALWVLGIEKDMQSAQEHGSKIWALRNT